MSLNLRSFFNSYANLQINSRTRSSATQIKHKLLFEHARKKTQLFNVFKTLQGDEPFLLICTRIFTLL